MCCMLSFKKKLEETHDTGLILLDHLWKLPSIRAHIRASSFETDRASVVVAADGSPAAVFDVGARLWSVG